MTRRLFPFALAAFAIAFLASMLFLRTSAKADDYYRTTSFASTSVDYGLGEGSQSAFIATIVSTYPGDATCEISVYSTNPNESEDLDGETTAARNTGTGLWAQLSAPVDQRASGTAYRARFRAYDSSGNVNFQYNRTFTLP